MATLTQVNDACRIAKFNGVHTLTLHIPENFGADRTTITFIGLKGEFQEVRCGAVQITMGYTVGKHAQAQVVLTLVVRCRGRWVQWLPCTRHEHCLKITNCLMTPAEQAK